MGKRNRYFPTKPHLIAPIVPKQEKHRKNKRLHRVDGLGIFCRSVACGGTDVDFFRVGDTDEILAVWTNENCPYSETVEDTSIALDGHNVSKLSRKAIIEALGGTCK
jgi:hypothetical protein